MIAIDYSILVCIAHDYSHHLVLAMRASNVLGNKAIKAVDSLKEGDVILMENVRFYPEEIKGDVDFARKLSQLGDYFVNDAFGSVHRAHSSTSIIADFFKGKKFAGILLEKEIKSIDRVLKNGENPITAIVGGAKVSSKITVIENLLERAFLICIYRIIKDETMVEFRPVRSPGDNEATIQITR